MSLEMTSGGPAAARAHGSPMPTRRKARAKERKEKAKARRRARKAKEPPTGLLGARPTRHGERQRMPPMLPNRPKQKRTRWRQTENPATKRRQTELRQKGSRKKKG